MRRTNAGDLLAPFVVAFLLTYLLLRAAYGSLPPLQYVEALPIVALAIAELIAARRVRMAVRHVPDAKPMTAIAIARCVALGKATALVAAGVVGVSIGLLVRVIPDAGTVRAASGDLRVGVVLLAGSVLLLAAGLLLERSGVVPRNDQDRPLHS